MTQILTSVRTREIRLYMRTVDGDSEGQKNKRSLTSFRRRHLQL